MSAFKQPTRGQNAWQNPSTAQPGFDVYKSSGPASQAPQQGQAPQQSSNQPNMSAYGGMPVTSPMGNFQSLGQYQQHQDAFVQQYLQSQNQYNQGLIQGQQVAPVEVGDVWRQAGENIANGTYQGNPFATGNVQALMGMFDQYGIPAPAGFQDQLVAISAQSPPSMYQPPPGLMGDYGRPGQQTPAPGLVPFVFGEGSRSPETRYVTPQQAENLRQRESMTPADRERMAEMIQGIQGMFSPPQPMTGFPIGPQGEYWPGGPGPQPTAPAQGQVWKGGTPYFDERTGQQSPPSMYQPPSQMPRMPSIEAPAADNRKVVFGPQFGEGLTDSEYVAWKSYQASLPQKWEQQAREMQAKYPLLDPVYKPGQTSGKVIGWQPNPGRVAEAERQEAQERLDSGWIRGPVKASGEQTWVSPQQQAVRAEQATSLSAARAAAVAKSRASGADKRQPPRSPSRAQPAPERSSGTAYVPPSNRKGPTGDAEYDDWFAKLMPRRRR